MGIEQRLEKRRHLYIYLKVTDTETGEEIGRIANMTSNGLLIIGKEKYENGTGIDVSIDIRDLNANVDMEKIDIHVVSRWSRPDINPDYYVTGFLAEFPDEATQQAVDFVIEAIGFKD